MMSAPRKKVLVVGTHFDVTRLPLRRPNKYPMGMGAAYLAGAFARDLCDVRCYNEVSSGPLVDESLLGWPDMIVLTGLSVCFDRMLHITAHAKSKNERVIVVAGGPPIRILPRYAEQFFDYVCTGDIEQLCDVIRDAFGPEYVAEEMLPRMDLAYWIKKHGHAESSRNCNFACSFCSLTGEGARYQKYDIDYFRKQLELVGATGRKYSMHFIDNNFYGNDRQFFRNRIALIDEFRRRKFFKYWTALLTGDFYLSEENLRLVAEAGCAGFFTGIESFDQQSLRNFNKLQNTHLPQVELMRRSLRHGLVVFYGLFADIYNRSLDEIRDELEFIFGNHEMMLPSFITLPIPLIGTPFFAECLRQERFLPLTKLRDLDGSTISLHPPVPMDRVVRFVRELQNLSGYRGAIARHAAGFFRTYRNQLTTQRMVLALVPNALLAFNKWMTGGAGQASKGIERSHVSTTEVLDPCYVPSFRIASRYEAYFKPTMLTDAAGRLNVDLEGDLGATRTERAVPARQI